MTAVLPPVAPVPGRHRAPDAATTGSLGPIPQDLTGRGAHGAPAGRVDPRMPRTGPPTPHGGQRPVSQPSMNRVARTAGLSLAALGALAGAGGAADMASAAFRTSMLQSAAADEVRGRLQGIFIVVVAGGPRVADVAHGATAAATGAAVAAAGGGLLVVVFTVAAALAVPAFVRYRVTRVVA